MIGAYVWNSLVLREMVSKIYYVYKTIKKTKWNTNIPREKHESSREGASKWTRCPFKDTLLGEWSKINYQKENKKHPVYLLRCFSKMFSMADSESLLPSQFVGKFIFHSICVVDIKFVYLRLRTFIQPQSNSDALFSLRCAPDRGLAHLSRKVYHTMCERDCWATACTRGNSLE